jgi:hypothetical protein
VSQVKYYLKKSGIKLLTAMCLANGVPKCISHEGTKRIQKGIHFKLTKGECEYRVSRKNAKNTFHTKGTKGI